jgi:ABC-2 type transport system ATP-binding protein
MPAIEVKGLSKHYGKLVAVDDLSFSVGRGTVVGFLGPNGAGKTTTLRALLGLVEPTRGAATINGQRYRGLEDPLRHVGAVLEASNFYPGRSARNHLRILALASSVAPGRVDEALELVGLTDAADRRVGEFSLGMRQRLGIAGALLGKPEILILDEPANGLDPEGVRWLRELLRAQADDGRAVLISSHMLAETSQTVDSVIIIDQGRLVTQSSLEDLATGAQRIVRVRTPQAQALAEALGRDGAQVARAGSERLEITGTTPERVGMVAAQLQIPIIESTSEAAKLEDVFLRLTSDEELEEAVR